MNEIALTRAHIAVSSATRRKKAQLQNTILILGGKFQSLQIQQEKDTSGCNNHYVLVYFIYTCKQKRFTTY